MGVFDEVMNFKNQGLSDAEIIKKLQEQGISPLEVSEIMSRVQIKNAVSSEGMGSDGMEPSILGAEDEPERLPLEGLEGGTLSDEDLTPPKPMGFPAQASMPMRVTKEISGAEMYTPQEEDVYSPQPQYQYQQPQENETYSPYVPQTSGIGDTDTIIEVAEQVFLEKNKSVQRKVDELNEFRVLTQTKLENVSDRLKRMESIIDRLQASILEKVGSYGQDLESVRKEMSMMQDSFGKVINKIADESEARKHHHIHHQAKEHKPEHHVVVHKSTKRTIRRNRK